MSAQNPNDGLARVRNLRRQISPTTPYASFILPLIARYEELDAEITRFSQV
jgi:hypothetical protein